MSRHFSESGLDALLDDPDCRRDLLCICLTHDLSFVRFHRQKIRDIALTNLPWSGVVSSIAATKE